MFEIRTCSQEDYDFLRMMGLHRKSLIRSVLKAIEEDGWIEWEDHSYSTICDARELRDPTFGLLKRIIMSPRNRTALEAEKGRTDLLEEESKGA